MPSNTRQPEPTTDRGLLVRAWVACSMPAFVLGSLAVVLELLAFGAMPQLVPRHIRFAGPPDAWWPRTSWLAFAVGMTVFFAVMILLGGLLLGMSPSNFRLRDKGATRYWTQPDNWPLMRQRLWLLMGWLSGFFALYLAISLGIFALSPSWELPHWVNFAVMLAGLGAGVIWLFTALRRMTAPSDEVRN